MNNDTYGAILAYKATEERWRRLQDEADEEKAKLYDQWSAVVWSCGGHGERALEALNSARKALEDFEKEQMRCKTKTTKSSDDTCDCESTG